MDLQSGHRAHVLPEEETACLKSRFRCYNSCIIRLQPGSWLFPECFTKWADKFYNFELKPTDTVIMSYPKCGSTWMKEIVWTIKNNPDLDNPKQHMPFNFRIPFIAMDTLLQTDKARSESATDPSLKYFSEMCPGCRVEDVVQLQLAKCSPEPRTLVTHLPLSLMPKNLLETAKLIYVARDPKDCCVSYLHHSKIFNFLGYAGTADEFVDLFTQKGLYYGCYAEHFNEAWKYRDHPNMHFVFYEDLKANILKELQRLGKFIGTHLTEKQFHKVIHHTSFAEMKKRESLVDCSKTLFKDEVKQKEGGFFWKGKSGNWKETLTLEQMQRVDRWVKDNFHDPEIVKRFTVEM